jgi:hypothetical protein
VQGRETMLPEVARLTKDASPSGRRRLLDAVTNLFLSDRSPSIKLQEHYSDIATCSVDALSIEDRAAYAQRVAAERRPQELFGRERGAARPGVERLSRPAPR